MDMKRIRARNLAAGLPTAILVAVIFASCANAQVRGMGGRGSAARSVTPFGPGRRIGLSHAGRYRRFNDSAFLPIGYFYPDFPDYDYDDEAVPPVTSPVQIVVAPPSQPPAPAPIPAQPLLLELREGQWVQVPTAVPALASPQSVQSGSAKSPNPAASTAGQKQAAQPTPVSPRAVLVFRDGHQEEVATYMIQGDLIYASTDYWSTGSWTRKIPVAELDVPATLKLNQERGGKFSLPSGPSEIVIRF
jgi:hypothetical protein